MHESDDFPPVIFGNGAPRKAESPALAGHGIAAQQT